MKEAWYLKMLLCLISRSCSLRYFKATKQSWRSRLKTLWSADWGGNTFDVHMQNIFRPGWSNLTDPAERSIFISIFGYQTLWSVYISWPSLWLTGLVILSPPEFQKLSCRPRNPGLWSSYSAYVHCTGRTLIRSVLSHQAKSRSKTRIVASSLVGRDHDGICMTCECQMWFITVDPP